ncbi:MAG TPA: DUF4350 domain-containing protein [Candidatus Thermoplasmatota archaeon]|nr:DUF4350 domain-containing protein [Candidatus Thermoplasmatota archaeon]
MRRATGRFYALTALVLVVAALVTAALMQPIVGTRTDFSLFNTRWNGASGFAAEAHGAGGLVPAFDVAEDDGNLSIVHRSFAEFAPDPGGASLVVLGPGSDPNEEEAAWLRQFVRAGGRALVADDFGRGNAFLEAIGAKTRFAGDALAGLAYARSPGFVVSANFTAHPLVEGVSESVLSFPTALDLGGSATSLARTDGSTWLDRDRDLERDAGEQAGPFTWIAVERVGAGEVLIVADPSVFVNGLRPLGDNARLASNAIAWLAIDGRRILIDESHRDYPDPVRFLGASLRALPETWRLGLAVGGFLAFVAFASVDGRALARRPRAALERLLGRLLPPARPRTRDLVAEARKRHPDWDESALTDILAQWKVKP